MLSLHPGLSPYVGPHLLAGRIMSYKPLLKLDLFTLPLCTWRQQKQYDLSFDGPTTSPHETNPQGSKKISLSCQKCSSSYCFSWKCHKYLVFGQTKQSSLFFIRCFKSGATVRMMSRRHYTTTDCLITQSWRETISYAVLFNVTLTNALIGRLHFVTVFKFFLIAIIKVGLNKICFMQKKIKTATLLSLLVMFECLPTPCLFNAVIYIFFFSYLIFCLSSTSFLSSFYSHQSSLHSHLILPSLFHEYGSIFKTGSH